MFRRRVDQPEISVVSHVLILENHLIDGTDLSYPIAGLFLTLAAARRAVPGTIAALFSEVS
jgi:hypothetical protein